MGSSPVRLIKKKKNFDFLLLKKLFHKSKKELKLKTLRGDYSLMAEY
jgi:hypothetical protein